MIRTTVSVKKMVSNLILGSGKLVLVFFYKEQGLWKYPLNRVKVTRNVSGFLYRNGKTRCDRENTSEIPGVWGHYKECLRILKEMGKRDAIVRA